MFKLKLTALFVLFTLVLSACSSVSATLTTTSLATSNTLNSKLGVGLLSLEGTSQAVTPEQAGSLIPLWQVYKSLSASSTSSPTEIQALYRQIQETLTSDQIVAIQQNEFNQETVSALMQQYNVKGMQGAGAQPQSSSTQKTAAYSANGDLAGGSPPLDLGTGGGSGGDLGGTIGSQTGTTASTINTLQTASTATIVDLNTLFADAVLQVLTQRALS